MKRRFFMNLLLMLLVALPLAAQKAGTKLVTLTFQNEPLSTSLKRIEKASDVKIPFVYDDVKAMYDKYHVQGLEVVMVSDDDTSPEAAVKAIEEDGTGMFHHVLRGLKRNLEGAADPFDRNEDVSGQYAIHYLPTKYLIDRDFNIIGKVSDEELEEKLVELFGF